MTDRDPTRREIARAKRQLERAGLGELANDPPELAEVRRLLLPDGCYPDSYAHETGDEDQAAAAELRDLGYHGLADAIERPSYTLPPVNEHHGRWIGRTSGPDVFIAGPCGQRGCVICDRPPGESQRLAEVLIDADPGAVVAMGYDPSEPGAREEATAIMRKYIDAGRRCQACASLDCPGAYGTVDLCPRWQEAEQRNARGEYLPTRPGPRFEVVSDMPAGPPEPWLTERQLAEPDTLRWSPDAYTYKAGPEVPRPYGGPLSDPWGRPWCDCGEPLELHAHIRGSVTGAWCYAPRDVLRPGELLARMKRDRLGRALRAAALVLIGGAAGLLILYAIVVIMVINALSG